MNDEIFTDFRGKIAIRHTSVNDEIFTDFRGKIAIRHTSVNDEIFTDLVNQSLQACRPCCIISVTLSLSFLINYRGCSFRHM